MTNEERTAWLNERRKGIGGSDVAAIVGISPWATPLDIYEQKLGIAPPAHETEAMYWGTALEPAIRQAYSDKTGYLVKKPENAFVHPKYSFMRANLDGIVLNDNRITEFKTASTSKGWGEPGSDEIPDYYLTQVQHYMAVVDRPVCDVAVLVAGRDFSIYTVEADKELQEQLIEIEAEFWNKVENQIPPEPTNYKEFQKIRKQSFPESGCIEADPDVIEVVQQYLEADAEEKAVSERLSDLKKKIAELLGDNNAFTLNGKKLVSWKRGATCKRINSAYLKTNYPEVFEKCSTVSTNAPSLTFSRTLLSA